MQRLWQKTPLVRSIALSEQTGCDVYLKIELFQTSGSFKGRGVVHFVNQAVKHYLQCNGLTPLDTKALARTLAKEDIETWSIPISISDIPEEKLPHLVIASSGSAGLAVANVSSILGVPCTIFVPDEQANMIHMFTRYGPNVEVRVGGANYSVASQAAQTFVKELGGRGIYVPGFDDPLVWQGNATLCLELAEQLSGVKPDAIFCSVGGGGLIAGTMLGCEMVPGWSDVPIVGVETIGTACFLHSMQSNRQACASAALALPEGATMTRVEVPDPLFGLTTNTRVQAPVERVSLVRLGAIRSLASSLGASSPSPSAVSMALRRKGPVHCVAISDERAMSAALRFTDDHQTMTELACSATLVPAYTPHLLEHILDGLHTPNQEKRKVLVFVLCGGCKGSLEAMRLFQERLSDWQGDDIIMDGNRLTPCILDEPRTNA